MRLWHKDLISVLPRQQLLSQWRECCCIARNIAVNGTPNHLLINKVLEYPKWHFMEYSLIVCMEMERRGYKVNRKNFFKWFDLIEEKSIKYEIKRERLFIGWHNERYFLQCYYNLQEKYDCGGITEEEWKLIQWYFDEH